MVQVLGSEVHITAKVAENPAPTFGENVLLTATFPSANQEEWCYLTCLAPGRSRSDFLKTNLRPGQWVYMKGELQRNTNDVILFVEKILPLAKFKEVVEEVHSKRYIRKTPENIGRYIP